MGRAARANPRTAVKSALVDGPRNPVAAQLSQRGYNLNAPAFRRARAQGQTPIVRLAGRIYAIDTNGMFRRVKVVDAKPQGLEPAK